MMDKVVHINFKAKLFIPRKSVKFNAITNLYTAEFRHDGTVYSFDMDTPYHARLHASRAYAQLLNLDISAYDDAIGSPLFMMTKTGLIA